MQKKHGGFAFPFESPARKGTAARELLHVAKSLAEVPDGSTGLREGTSMEDLPSRTECMPLKKLLMSESFCRAWGLRVLSCARNGGPCLRSLCRMTHSR